MAELKQPIGEPARDAAGQSSRDAPTPDGAYLAVRQGVEPGYGVGVGVGVRVGVVSGEVGGVGVEVGVRVTVLVAVEVAVRAPITGSVAGPDVGALRVAVGDGRAGGIVGDKGKAPDGVTAGEEDTGADVRVSGAVVLPSGTTAMPTSGVAR